MFICSRKQKVIALSSTEIEYRVQTNTTTEIACLKSLFSELGLQFTTLIMWCDNQNTSALAANPALHAKTKQIEIDAHYVRVRY